MNYCDVEELHYITHIENIKSILRYGILSNKRAVEVNHISIAMTEIQEIREDKKVPNGRFLHDYVNLYFCARNPMLYSRKEMHKNICVLKVHPSILKLPNVVISDRNASGNYAKFFPFPDGLKYIEKERVFAEYWTHGDDMFETWVHKSIKCAEALIPDKIIPKHIAGAYVSCTESKNEIKKICDKLEIVVNSHMFFN